MELETKMYVAWAHISRSEDVADQWVAYCPAFDAMTLGGSPVHAREMIEEAVGLLITMDLNEGRDPEARRSTREEDWAALYRLFESHKQKVPVNRMDERAEFKEFAVPITWTFERQVVDAAGNGSQTEMRERGIYPTGDPLAA